MAFMGRLCLPGASTPMEGGVGVAARTPRPRQRLLEVSVVIRVPIAAGCSIPFMADW